MPTPFTHLAFARRLRDDDAISPSLRALIEAEWGAFLLGSIVADAHGLESIAREASHFYTYDRPIDPHPWLAMLACHPTLRTPHSRAQHAFLAGYVGHLSMDEVWSMNMLRPHFAERSWAPRARRFLMLHVILIYMDERDLASLPSSMAADLASAQPDNWLPFMRDETLRAWGEVIHRQIMPGGISETLEIFGGRINQTPEQLRAILDSTERMEAELWTHIPRSLLAEIEAQMYAHAKAQMEWYVTGSNT